MDADEREYVLHPRWRMRKIRVLHPRHPVPQQLLWHELPHFSHRYRRELKSQAISDENRFFFRTHFSGFHVE